MRLVSLCALIASKDKINKILTEVQQLGAGIPDATTGVAEAVRLFLLDPEADAAADDFACAAQLDWANAYNTIDRTVVLSEVARRLPELLPFVRLGYCTPGELHFSAPGAGPTSHKVFASATGVRQGDPMGPVLFCLAYAVALRATRAAHPDTPFSLPSYIDDTTVLARRTAALAVVATLVGEGAKIGLVANPTKSFAYSAAHTVTPDHCAGSVLTPAPDGVVSLGTPVGTAAFVAEHVRARFSGSFAQLRLLPHVGNLQCTLRVLRLSVVPRAEFLASTLSLAEAGPLLGEWDAALVAALRGIRCLPPGAPLSPRCFLVGKGGLGVAPIAPRHAAVRLNGWSRSAALIRAHLPGLAGLTHVAADGAHPVHASLHAAWAALPTALQTLEVVVKKRDGSEEKTTVRNAAELANLDPSKAPAARTALSSSLSDHLRLAAHTSLSPLGQHLFALSRLPGANEWLEVVPTFPAAQMTDEQYRVALALWLGEHVPVLEGVAGVTDPTGRATLVSNRGPGRTGRHDYINAVLMDMEVEAGAMRVVREPRGLLHSLASAEAAEAAALAADPTHVPKRDNRRGDHLAIFQAGALKRVVDVVVHDSANAKAVAKADHLRFPARGLAKAEKDKDTRYNRDLKPGYVFEAFGMGTQSELGATAQAVVGRLAADIAKRQYGGEEPPDGVAARIAISLRARLGITIMRAQADQVLDVGLGRVAPRSMRSDGSAGLRPWGERWTHSRHRAPAGSLVCTCRLPTPAGGGGAQPPGGAAVCVCFGDARCG